MSDPRDPDSPAVYVARQPILGRDRRRFAYELLFRASQDAGSAEFPTAATATARVIVNSVLSMGTASVLGGSRGFVNCDHEMLASEAIEVLSPERFVLEVLETVPDSAAARCRELARLGFELALDDYTPEDSREDLLAVCDYIKVDLPAISTKDLPAVVRDLRRHGKRLLAEKVETEEEFKLCHELGFHLFQGYYFARPTTLTGRRLDTDAAALLSVFRDLSGEIDVDDLEDQFKRHTRLGINLLRLVNSAAMATRNQITGLRHALVYLGRVQLRRWVLLMLYAGEGGSTASNPLLELAAIRGRLLELLLPACRVGNGASGQLGDRAFLTGMLSLAHSLLGADAGDLLAELRVEPEIRAAVLERAGLLGALLRAVECLEVGRFDDLSEELHHLGISSEQLAHAQREAYLWIQSLDADAAPAEATPA